MTDFFELFFRLPSNASFCLIVAVALLCTSIFFGVNSKLRPAILFVFLSSLALGFSFALIDPFLHIWDEQFHALVAKNLANNPLLPELYTETPLEYPFKDWSRNGVWLHKQPLSLWQIALSITFFGANELAVRLPSIIMHAVLVFPIFRIGTLAMNARIGWLTVVLFTWLHYPLELVGGFYTTDHIDSTFLFYITLSIWAFAEYISFRQIKWIIWLGIFAGLAVLTKWAVGLLVFSGYGFLLLYLYSFRNSGTEWIRFFIALGITLLIALPWQIYCAIHFPMEFMHEMNYNSLHFTKVIEGHGGGPFFYWYNLSTLYGSGDLIKVLILISLFTFYSFSKNKKLAIALLIFTLVPYGFFTLATTKMDSFLIIVSPLIILMLVTLGVKVLDEIGRQISMFSKPVFSFVVIIYFCFSLLRPSTILQNHWLSDHFDPEYRREWIYYHEFMKTVDKPDHEKWAIMNSNQLLKMYIPWMFYQENIIAYDFPPDPQQQDKLLSEGYQLFELAGDVKEKALFLRPLK